MNLLMVDNAQIEVKGLTASMPWENWGIDRVFTAYDIEAAKRIIADRHIHLLLCDIEMPMGSGIDLMEWINANAAYPIATILLTCHPDFEYAKRAISLGCSNYLLKPAEEETLGEAVLKAEEEILRRERDTSFRPEESFWKDIVEGQVWSRRDIALLEEKYGVQMADKFFRPLVISVIQGGEKTRSINPFLLGFIYRNIAEELFSGHEPVVIRQTEDQMMLMLRAGNGGTAAGEDAGGQAPDQGEEQELKESARAMISLFREHYDISLTVYLGRRTMPEEACAAIAGIAAYSKQCAMGGEVFSESYHPAFLPFSLPEEKIRLWRELFARESFPEAVSQMADYFGELKVWQIPRQDFKSAAHRLMREFESVSQKDSEALKMLSQLYDSGEYAVDTVPGLMAMMERLSGGLSAGGAADPQDAVEQVKTYVSMNIDREITREQLAAYVSMNPDYLNRLFKKATGMSLKEYISSMKADVAKELLANTDFLVGEIGGMVGYANFSSFTTFFKKNTGVTPESWREKHRSI